MADGRQTSNNRGGRGQSRHFSREGMQRLREGARKGGQNSHRNDASNDRNGGGGRSDRGDQMDVGNQRAIDMLSPQAQEQIREEIREELYDEVRDDVLNEAHQKLDEIGHNRGDEDYNDRDRGNGDNDR